MRGWARVLSLKHRRRVELDRARAHLEQSRRERPEVDQIAGALRREYRRNRLAERVDASLRGRA